jgi:hypothetical protein
MRSAIAIAALVLALSSCHFSRAPLITPATADYPIASDSHFDAFARRGTDWRPLPEGRTIRRSGDFYFYRRDGSDETSPPFLMKEVSPDRYVVQMPDAADPQNVTQYYYALFDFDGAEAIQYSASCWPREEWIADGWIVAVQQTSMGTRCEFDDLESLVAVLEGTSEYTAPQERLVLSTP